MKQRIRYIIFCTIILINLLAISQNNAQTYKETLQFAEKQFSEGNYDLALKAYQRLIFFSEATEIFPLYLKAAEIAIIGNNLELAQTNFGLAYNLTDNDSLKNELLLKKAFCQMRSKNYHYATIDLLSINDQNKIFEKRLNFYLGTCYFGMEDFDQSKQHFGLCVSPESKLKLEKLFSKKNLYSPSPKKARILSLIIPGFGQFYSGYFKDGVNSFLLSASLIAIGINSALVYDPLYAIVSVLPWYQRYFTGGYTRAEAMAVQKRQNNRNEIYNKIIVLIENDFSDK
ncbi:MAG: hypothetical protein IPH57_07275 [Saprospiraceae bacterium]|nr:hypothetical protein [Saprospiraceae bacterium]